VGVTVTGSPEAFRARVEGWLAARPVEHNVLVTVAAAAHEGTFAWLEEDGAVRAAVLRTPPHLLLGSMLDRRRLADDRLFVWDDGGPVSLVGTSPPVAGVVRVSLVYTPPAARGRGYASALVAAVSRRAMAAGAPQCMLYADGANPTANRVYQAVGYRRVTDARDYAFERR